MKIALVGYGKMGKVIESIAKDRNHEIVARYNSSNPLNESNWVNCDVVIEFTSPEIAAKNIEFCLNKNTAICIGSTGWYDDYDRLSQLCTNQQGAMLSATNFSVGVNIYWQIAAYASRLFSQVEGYKTAIVENHHTEKKDSPSGTAITLAECFIENQKTIEQWKLQNTLWEENAKNFKIEKSAFELNDDGVLPIIALREEGVPGTHQLLQFGEHDTIKLEHKAISRRGFAEGAVLAAEWLKDKKGVFRMSDMLKFEA